MEKTINKFNEHGICTNPTDHDYSVKCSQIKISTASNGDAWGFGLCVTNKSGSGYCHGVSIDSLHYKSEQSAIQAALQVVSSRFNLNVVKQLELFTI